MNKTFVFFLIIALIAFVSAARECADDSRSGCATKPGCSWCVFSKSFGFDLPPQCVDTDFTRNVTPDVASCEHFSKEDRLFKEVVGNCYDDVSTKDRCLNSKDDQGDCLWCLAKAVPSVCANPSQAARLPEGVFICGYNATNPHF